MPALRRAGGLRESGLPYAADAAISKHLARFLTRAKANITSSPQLLESVGGSAKIDSAPLLIPDAVLFNGGVFNASPLRARVLDQLSRWANRPIRELEGALTRIRGLAMANNQPISLELAKQAIDGDLESRGGNAPSLQSIIESVTRFYDVKLIDLLSKRRHKSIAMPRQVCMYLARKHTRFSLEEIGGYFGGRDHTTVMHAVRTIEEKASADQKLQAEVDRIEQDLLQRASR
jgi:chromosomal replication initiator protein